MAIVGATLALLAAGCSDSKPGEKIVTPTPTKVVGNVAKPTAPVGNPTAGKQVSTTLASASPFSRALYFF